MQILTITKSIAGEEITFTNRKALWWQRQEALIISDIHIGKAAHFRKNGIAVSSQTLYDDLECLAKIIAYFRPVQLIIVGDFLHAGGNSDLDIFCNWRAQFPDLKIYLVRGNHDRFSPKILEKACVEVCDATMELAPFTLVHDPADNHGGFCISGHIHPGVILYDIQRIKLPCFAYSANQLVLPAFSKFTGLDTRSLDKTYRKIAFTEDLILEIH